MRTLHLRRLASAAAAMLWSGFAVAQSFGDPSLNDMGAVAFTGSFPNGSQGLFVRTKAAAATVLLSGDVLDRAPVSFITFCRGGLNNLGQLAFDAQLAGGPGSDFSRDTGAVMRRGEPLRKSIQLLNYLRVGDGFE